MTSVHAHSAREALVKLTTLPLLAGENVSHRFILPTVAATIDLIVFLRGDGWGRRRVEEILAVSGRVEEDQVEASLVFRRTGDRLLWTGEFPRTPSASATTAWSWSRSWPREPDEHDAEGGRSGWSVVPPGGDVVDELAVLVIPSVLVTGLVLVGLGVDGRARVVRSRRRVGRFQEWATQAGIRRVRLWHVVAVCGGAGLTVGVAVLGLTRSVWLALAFGGLAGWLPLGALRARRRRRLRELREVWPDAIDNMASGVRAGLSLPEAVAGLAERGPEALRAPFARFADDYHANGRFGLALDRLKQELADPTADRVVEALRLAREVGGSELGRTLRTLSGFLRDEQRVRKELEARQTWVVVAARMAFATPWAVLLLLATKPEAVAAYRGTGGAVVLAIGAAMAVTGYRMMLAIGRLPAEERVLR